MGDSDLALGTPAFLNSGSSWLDAPFIADHAASVGADGYAPDAAAAGVACSLREVASGR